MELLRNQSEKPRLYQVIWRKMGEMSLGDEPLIRISTPDGLDHDMVEELNHDLATGKLMLNACDPLESYLRSEQLP